MSQTILFFEPINHMYKVLISLAKRDYKIIAFHTMPINAVAPYEQANELIEQAIEIKSWYDFDALEKIVNDIQKDHDIKGIYAGAEITLPFEAYIKEKLGLPTNGYETTLRNLDKYRVRKTLAEKGLTQLACFSKSELEAMDSWPLQGAGFFKPANGAGSANVWRINSIEQLRKCQLQWNDKSNIMYDFLRDYMEKNDEYFLEQEAQGELMSVEVMTFEGQSQVLGMTSRSVASRDSAIEMGCSFPYEHKFKAQIIEKVLQYHQALDIKHGATHTEVIVDEDGNVELVEMNLRFAGYDMLYVISRAYDTDISQAIADLVVGQKPRLPELSDVKKFSGFLCIMPPDGLKTFDSIEFPEKIELSRVLKAVGHEFKSTDSQLDYVGSCIISADSYGALLDTAKEVRDGIKVNGKTFADDINAQVVLA